MMELNKYDLAEWVADMIINSDNEFCNHCMFISDLQCPACWDKQKVIKELIKKYNL